MATSKSKKTNKKSSNKPKAPEKSAKAEKINEPDHVKADKVETKTDQKSENKSEKTENKSERSSHNDNNEKSEKNFASKKPEVKICPKDWKLFDRKHPDDESIMTIFKNKKIWGSLIGEMLGTMLLTIIMFTFGANYILYIMLAIVAIIMAVYTLSGAHLNPIVTLGMIITRRVSAIRGVLYMVAQVVGAWLAVLLLGAFRGMGGEIAELPAMTAVTGDNFGMVVAVELLGAVLIGFFFARALQYRRSALTFAFVAMGGIVLALLAGLWLSGTFLGLSNNYIMNPAMALMMQIFPSAGDNVGEVLGGIGLALAAYVVLPMVGGAIGFLISDISSKFSGEKVCE